MRYGVALQCGLMMAALATATGCSSDDSGKDGDGALPPPDIGVQLESGKYTMEPGDEQYMCWSFEVPQDTALAVTRLEQQIPADGVHHYAVFTSAAPYQASSEPYECFSMGIDWGLVSGGGVGTPAVTFPEGSAMNIKGGQHLILQLHLLNSGSEPREIQPARINLVGSAEPESLEPVGLLIAGTLQIDIPPKSTDVDIVGGCTLSEPLENIFAVFPHMHQLGRRVRVDVIPESGERQVLTDEEWDFGDQGLYPANGRAVVGDKIEITCTYDNPTSENVKFGLHTGEEMCVEVLYHWPAKTPSKYCGLQ